MRKKSSDGTFGAGSYEKASCYGDVVLKFFIDLGNCYIVKSAFDPMIKHWQYYGYDSAYAAPGVLGFASDEENTGKALLFLGYLYVMK